MSGPTFFTTRMGVRFYEVTMPAIGDQLERLNTTLAPVIKVVAQLERLNTNLEALIAELKNGIGVLAARASA